MKTKLFNYVLFALLAAGNLFAQDVTTVRANSNDISDNLDLQAVASIFGDSRDLEDFERRLNDPSVQISNLDMNGDSRVDYLRVIEATEGATHLIILQSVLGPDTFQDVATIEVERDRSNNVRVQVVGDVYMYGPNYIYEPVYYTRPIIYDAFWVSSYRPYYSPWYWGYYPTYYTYWAPYPVYRYRNHVHVHVINTRNTYNYVNTRYSTRAVTLHSTRRANAYERQHPDRTFTRRTNLSNRYALEQTRTTNRSERGNEASRGTTVNSSRLSTNAVRNGGTTRSNGVTPVRSNSLSAQERTSGTQAVRNNTATRSNTVAPARSNSTTIRSNPSVAPARSTVGQPARQSSAPTTINRSSNFTRSESPGVRSSAPARSAAPAMRSSQAPSVRSSAPAPSRAAAPAASGRSASGNVRSSRG